MVRRSSPIEGVVYPTVARATQSFASGAWVDSTVGDALRATARAYPDRPAFISDERSITFRELDEQTERLAAALLDLGLKTGDRAILQIGTNIESVLVLTACFKAGIVPVCSLPQHREVEIGQLAGQSGARAYFVQADFSSFDLVSFATKMIDRTPALRYLVVTRGSAPGTSDIETLIANMPLDVAKQRLASIELDSQAVLSFQLSGGTTGVPKIIPRFHAEYLGHSTAWMNRYRISSESRLIYPLPIVHNAGQLYALMPPLAHGVTTILMPKADVVRMLELIEAHRVTHALSIGPIAPQLLAYQGVDRHDLSSLQLFATMSRADALEAHLNVPCSNLYGITEGLLLGSPAEASVFARHHTQGASGCRDDEIRLLEPDSENEVGPGAMGELCFRGPSTLCGFFDNPEANARAFTSDGFYRTGDMVTRHIIDGKTHVTFEGRLRDNVNRGGEKIGCEEVEAFVCQHPSVADAKLVAMPDEIYGEKGCIFIVTRPGAEPPDVSTLGAFLVAKGLAKFKCPERIEIIDEFPVTRVGKLDKPALKKRISDILTFEKSEEACPERNS
jgi:non-ribosomal peptide synthetase component E (peptide arylation enzyme)